MVVDTVLEVIDLAYSTPDGRPLQQGLGFRLGNRQLLLITGSNGCGKSTLLKAILGQFRIEHGTLSCAIPEKEIEYMPQLENTEIHLPLTLRDVLTISSSGKVPWGEIASFGLVKESQLDAAWNTASGGERKRTLLTRALLKRPRLLVFDEPMNHLDVESRAAMVRVIGKFLEAGAPWAPRAVVMVCHQGLAPDERGLFDVLHLNLDKPNPVAEALC